MKVTKIGLIIVIISLVMGAINIPYIVIENNIVSWIALTFCWGMAMLNAIFHKVDEC